jgi:hypothetical protein
MMSQSFGTVASNSLTTGRGSSVPGVGVYGLGSGFSAVVAIFAAISLLRQPRRLIPFSWSRLTIATRSRAGCGKGCEPPTFTSRPTPRRQPRGLAAACRLGRKGGRPPKLTDDDIEAAKAFLANPDIGVTQIAHRLGVSPATLYRYIPAARTANTPGV